VEPGGLKWILRVVCIARLELLVVIDRIAHTGLLQLVNSSGGQAVLRSGVDAGCGWPTYPKSISISAFGWLS